MPLAAGTRLGPYDIVSALGFGGMGEVYRARDTKLNRDVAIKVLPEMFAADADRLARFTREAQVLASLNHPNIAQIFGMSSEVISATYKAEMTSELIPINALVMELIEGEDLSAIIGRGPIALSDALPIATQITDALEAAHEHGIVHRDLKPANIKIRADGTVKVLDFGLAKALVSDAASAAADVQNSPTLTARGTQMGMILGTAAYMSPEQAKGRAVDKRADIWAFGVVLYEMLTGRRAFNGDGVSELLASVLKDPVDFSLLPPTAPPRLRMLVERCLERDVKLRLRDIGEARLELAKIADGRGDLSSPALATAVTPRASVLPWTVAGVGVVAALLMATLYLTRPRPELAGSVVFEVTAPDMSSAYAISPDGRQIIYRTASSQARPTSQLWLRSLGSLEAVPLPGTQGAQGVASQPVLGIAWSPDGHAAAFTGPGGVTRVEINTGQTAELVNGGMGILQVAGAWSRDGVILYGRRSGLEPKGNGIWRVADSASGTPALVTQFQNGDLFHVPSGFLPDGRHFLYFAQKSTDGSASEVRIGSIDEAPATQRTEALLTADGPAVYASGYLLFVSRGSLMAQPFDAERTRLTGTPALIASGVSSTMSVSDPGHLVYRADDGSAGALSELVRYGRDGKVVGKVGPPAVYGEVTAMADGKRIVVSRTDRGAPNHVFVVELARGVFSCLNPGSVGDYGSAPSPQDTVAYTYSPTGVGRDIYVRASNGVGEARRLVTSETVKHPNSWSPDGQFLIYDDHVPDRFQDLALVRRDGGAPIPFLATDADETLAQFSPDGLWIAYRSTETGRPEIYVRDFVPDRSPAYGTEKEQISVNGGDKPRWSPNGREIFYFQGNTLMAVPVRPGTPFHVGTAVPLFTANTAGYVPYDVLPDGTFVVNVPVPSASGAGSPLKVLLNWQSALPRNEK
jgi:Tol biopolymer transport system component